MTGTVFGVDRKELERVTTDIANTLKAYPDDVRKEAIRWISDKLRIYVRVHNFPSAGKKNNWHHSMFNGLPHDVEVPRAQIRESLPQHGEHYISNTLSFAVKCGKVKRVRSGVYIFPEENRNPDFFLTSEQGKTDDD